MRKHKHFFLTIGGTLLLTGVVVTTLTTTILTSQKNKHWGINPFQNYNFHQAEESLLKADIPTDLVDQYLTLSKEITGVIKTDKVIKSSELLTLDDAIINSISQQIIWNQQSSEQVQDKIDLVKPILMQFYEYYDQVYVPEHHLETDTLNAMQLESSNTDLYKWSIGTNLRDYGLIKDYLESAQEAWISKMSLAYILKTFLNKKIVHYNSLNQEATDGISAINQEIKELLLNKNQLLTDKIDAQNHIILMNNLLSSADSWELSLGIVYGLIMVASAVQLSMEWFPPVSWILTGITLGLGLEYTSIENRANKDLNLKTSALQDWFNETAQINELLGTTLDILKEVFKNSLSNIILVKANLAGEIMGFVGMALLTIDFGIQTNMFANTKSRIAGSDSEASKAVNSYITSLDSQMNNVSMTINNLNIKENDYMNQKILFNSKLNELSNYNQFFKEFDAMNSQTFTETNLFTVSRVEDWQKGVQEKYGYLTEGSTATDDFVRAFIKERNNFNSNYFKVQNQEQQFINNYNNNDKEYFTKIFLSYVDNPLKNDLKYFNELNLMWSNYDDILRG